tara:strand:- start:38 stop:280 length:243 start_codon:yes stop_codon:yes gene_type:complete
MIKHAYETNDLNLTATLCCLGYGIAHLDRSNAKRVVFFISGDQKAIQKDVERYWNGELKLSPSQLFLHQKALKQRLYSNE